VTRSKLAVVIGPSAATILREDSGETISISKKLLNPEKK
jgi:hypothetical protein